MENGPFTDDVPSKTSIYNGFSIAMLNYQMVTMVKNHYHDQFTQFLVVKSLGRRRRHGTPRHLREAHTEGATVCRGVGISTCQGSRENMGVSIVMGDPQLLDGCFMENLHKTYRWFRDIWGVASWNKTPPCLHILNSPAKDWLSSL